MKHIKTLGLLAVAVMALAAVFGTASASAAKFTSTGGKQKLTTSKVKQHVFTVTGSTVTCEEVEFSGETPGAEATEQTVTPSYKKCTAFGLPAEVVTTGCTITLKAATNAAGHAEAVVGGTKCESITILAKSIFGECHVDVTPQTVTGIHYVNNASPEDITVQITASGMSDHVTKSSGVCPLTVGTHTNASYTGEETVQTAGGVQYDAV